MGMKPIVLVPAGILVPTPLTRRPSSLAKEVLQTGAWLVFKRCQYSRDAPVAGSMTALMACSVCIVAIMLHAMAYLDRLCMVTGDLVQMLLMICWLRRVGYRCAVCMVSPVHPFPLIPVYMLAGGRPKPSTLGGVAVVVCRGRCCGGGDGDTWRGFLLLRFGDDDLRRRVGGGVAVGGIVTLGDDSGYDIGIWTGVGIGDGVGDGVGAMCFGVGTFDLSWENMSANVARALLVSVPKLTKGDAGAGLRRMWVKSFAASITKSAVDVAGMVTRWGKNSTVSLWRVPFVVGTYTV